MRHAPSTPMHVRRARERQAEEYARARPGREWEWQRVELGCGIERLTRRLQAIRQELDFRFGDLGLTPLTAEIAECELDWRQDLASLDKGLVRKLRYAEGECLRELGRLSRDLEAHEARAPHVERQPDPDEAPCE